MRKKSVVLVLAVLIIFALTGCAQTRSYIMGIIKDVPSWYYYPQSRIGRNEISFIGEGLSTESVRQSELVAYNNLFEKLEEYVGTELGREYYRDLINTGAIEDLALHVVVTDKTYLEKSGQYRTILLCAASEEIMTNLRTESRQEEYNREKEVIALVDEGDQCIKNSQDLKAVQLYLQSMILSHGLENLEDGYDYESILKEVKQILSTLSMKIVSSNQVEASCSVLVERRETILKTKVDMADVLASYICVDGLGNSWEDSYAFTSDSDGVFHFRSVNYTLTTVGQIVFTFNIYDEISGIRAFDEETAEELSRLVEEKRTVFSYDKTLNSTLMGLVVFTYDSSWNREDNQNWSDYLQNRLISDSLASFKVSYTEQADLNLDGDLSDSEILSYLLKIEDRDIETALILRMGPLKQSTATGVYHTVVEGKAVFYSKLDSSTFSESPVLNVSGFGESAEEALTNAYRNICNIIYDWLKGNYV